MAKRDTRGACRGGLISHTAIAVSRATLAKAATAIRVTRRDGDAAGGHRLGGGKRKRVVDLQSGNSGRIEPSCAVLLQTAAEEPSNRRRCSTGDSRQIALCLQHRFEHLRVGFAREDRSSGQHLQQDDAKSPEVAARVGRPAGHLLGAHVAGRAKDQTRVRVRRGACLRPS